MVDILAVVRPDHDTDWVARFLIEMYQRERVHVHLVSVRCPFNGHVRMFFDETLLHDFHREDAETELAPVRQALDAAGVPYETIASMKGVEQLDLLDGQNSIVIARAGAALNLQIVPLP